MFRSYFLHKSYFEDLYDAAHPCENPSYDFDKAKARALLSEAGWRANPATGWLEKDGKPLVVRFLNRDMTSDKFLTVYREDLRDVGIQLEVERKDVAAWFRDMDAFNFEMTWAAWGSGLFKDPESAWHSKEADRPSGNNITGFRDARVDALIERQKTEFDVAKRNGCSGTRPPRACSTGTVSGCLRRSCRDSATKVARSAIGGSIPIPMPTCATPCGKAMPFRNGLSMSISTLYSVPYNHRFEEGQRHGQRREVQPDDSGAA
jgi:hypothetical protein